MVDLARLGVVLTVEGDRLRFRAPAGVLTAELRAAVAANRAEILARMAADVVFNPGCEVVINLVCPTPREIATVGPPATPIQPLPATAATPDPSTSGVAPAMAPKGIENGTVKAGTPNGLTVPNGTPRCLTHNDPRDWIDHPSVDGWVRTTCRRCGTWIGNRPVEVAEAGRRKQAAKAAATIFGTCKPNPKPAEPTR